MDPNNPTLPDLAKLNEQDLARITPAIRTIARSLIALSQREVAQPPSELEKAVNELATLVNQAVATLTASDNSLKADVTYLQQKIGEHQTQLSELFGATPSKITDRLTGIESSIIEIRRRLDAAETDLSEQHCQITDIAGCALDSINKQLDATDARLDTQVARVDNLSTEASTHASDPELHVLA